MKTFFAIVLFAVLCSAMLGDGVTATRRLTGFVNFSAKTCKAVASRDGEFIRQLLQRNIKYLCEVRCGNDNDTLLHESAVSEAITAADLLLTPPANCNVDPLDSEGNTPLHDAAAICQSPMTSLFLNFGANPNAVNNDGFTPLCLAASQNNENCGGVAHTLIKAGAKCQMKCDGKLPIELAANKVTKDILMSKCTRSMAGHN